MTSWASSNVGGACEVAQCFSGVSNSLSLSEPRVKIRKLFQKSKLRWWLASEQRASSLSKGTSQQEVKKTYITMSWKSSPALWNMEPRPLRTKHAQSTNKACSVYKEGMLSRRVDNVMHCLSRIVSHETYKHNVDYYAELVSPVVYKCTQVCWCKVALHLGSIAAALQISLWYN